ncbi:MAG TPA: galactokinase [Caldilineaceae bacterium]|nr:galactokinase [Caldilineaceae bacterium]
MRDAALAAVNDALTPIYGPGAPAQRQRYRDALAYFRQLYGPGPVAILRAPGRVNIIGEHTDYNHGFVLPAALDKDILLLARPRADRELHVANIEPAFEPFHFTLAQTIPPAAPGHWSNYLRGAGQMVANQSPTMPPGMDALVVGAAPFGVPRGAGLSSSSALVVATAVALAHFAGWQPDLAHLAHLCADAEWYVGTRGGMMDHFAALLSRRDHALFLDCLPDANGQYTFRHIPFPSSHRLLVVDSGVHHDNVRGEYNQRVAACRAALLLLERLAPPMPDLRVLQDAPWPRIERELVGEITPAELAQMGLKLDEIPGVAPDNPLRVMACVRHVWSENNRVLATIAALERNDVEEVGRLLIEAHASARDDYQISTPELDFLVDTAGRLDGVAGARLTGAGWGGCVVVLVAAGAVNQVEQALAAAYQGRFGRRPPTFVCQAGPGAGHVVTVTL